MLGYILIFSNIDQLQILFWFIIPTRCTSHRSLFNLIIVLHVSGVTITHLQEHKRTVSTTSGNHYTVLLSAAIVEKLELIWVWCRWRVHLCLVLITKQGTGKQNPLFQLVIDTMLTSATTWKHKQINTPPTTHSNQFQLIAFSAEYTSTLSL